MFYYYAVKSRTKLKRFQSDNGNVRLKHRRLFSTLEGARLTKPDAILVIDTQQVESPVAQSLSLVFENRASENPASENRAPETGASGSVNGKSFIEIPAAGVRNNSPYRPPEEIKAGGGIITRKKGGKRQILTIFRRGKWDLAKGKLDPGETIEECALREVREELGIKKVRLKRRLATTVHGYAEKNRFRVKTTHWYHMKTSETSFIPQREEGIDEVKWMNWKNAEKELGYETLRDLLASVRPLLRPTQ